MIAETTLPWRLLERASDDPARIALEARVNREWRVYSWAEVLAEVAFIALGLRQIGFGAGDTLAIFDVRRARVLFTILAAQALGGSVLPLQSRSSRFELRAAFRSRFAKIAFADSAEHLDKLRSLDAQALGTIVVGDRRALEAQTAEATASYATVRAAGARYGRLALGQLAVLAGRLAPSATAFEFVDGGEASDIHGVISHAELIGAAQRLRENGRLPGAGSIAVSPRLSSTWNSMLAVVAWLEYGFTVLTMEDEPAESSGPPPGERYGACRSSTSLPGARSAAAR